MNNFHEGDLIEAVKGKAKIGGVVSNWSGGGLGIEDTGWSIEALATHRFTVTVIERAKPALPTEPFTTIRAVYLPAGNANTKVTHLTLLPRSEGSNESRWAYSNGISVDNADLPRIQSFEVITAPVTATAKRMRDRLFMEFEESERSYTEDVEFVAAKFGVTGELGE